MNLDEIKGIVSQEKAVLVYFYSDSCNVCMALGPKIKTLFDEKFEKIKQLYIDAKAYPEIAAYFGIFSVPTLILFLEGKEFIKEGRALSLGELEQKLKRFYTMLFE